MNNQNDPCGLRHPATDDLGQQVLEATLVAVRQRHRHERQRNWTVLLIAVFTIGITGVWLIHEGVTSGSPSSAVRPLPGRQTDPSPAGARWVRVEQFSTAEVGPVATIVVRTADHPTSVSLISDEEFLDLCAVVGGGMFSLGSDQRIAVVASPSFDNHPLGL